MLLLLCLIFCLLQNISANMDNNYIFPPLPIGVIGSGNIVCEIQSREYRVNLDNFTMWAYEMREATAQSMTSVMRGNIFNMGNFQQCLTANAPFPTKYCMVEVTANVAAFETRDPFALYYSPKEDITNKLHVVREATAQSMTSVMRGNIFNMGNFQQCLTANAPFPTKYCMVEVTANVAAFETRDPFALYYSPKEDITNKLHYAGDVTQLARNVVEMGWCLPSSCTTLEAEKSLNEHLENLDSPLREKNVTLSARINPLFCQSSNQPSAFDVYDILFCILALGLILIVVLSTIWDFNSADVTKKHCARDFFMAFSARGNFKDLAKSESSDKSLDILYGIKTFSMCMIMLGHNVGVHIAGPVVNFDYIEKGYRDPFMACVFHADLFVDTFFALSGLLVIYTLMEVNKQRPTNPVLVIILRYFRLTPAYAFVVFFCATGLYYTGNGPLWEYLIGTERVDCRLNWWTNVLYVSNYVDFENTCVMAYWYLPCDFHYFIIAVGLLMLYYKSKKLALSAYAILVILSILVPFGIIFYYERHGLLRFLPDFNKDIKRHEDVLITYTKSHMRFSSYGIGIVAGYIFYQMKNKIVLSKCYANTILVFSFVLLGVTLFYSSIFYNPYHSYNRLEHAVYGSFHRPIWTLGTIGFIFAIGYGERGFIYNCLAWKVWVPISKLVFGAYLTHYLLGIRTIAIKNSSYNLEAFDLFCSSASIIFLGFVLGLVLYLIVEAPSKKLLRMMIVPQKQSKEESKTNESSNL